MSDLFNKRLATIVRIAELKPGLGKTVLMKFIYILQSVCKVPLGYDYKIYTYGPYANEVMEDIDMAESMGYLNIGSQPYDSWVMYHINASNTASKATDKMSEFLEKYCGQLEEVSDLVKGKSAKDLELMSTIIYLYDNYAKNRRTADANSISENVRELKPHFDLEVIQSEYERLNRSGILERVIS